MSYPIELPQVGESVTEAVITKWLTKIGDHVEKYDLLAEVVTDKVNMEFPAPISGIITEILVEEGATIPVGTVIARIDPDDGEIMDPVNQTQEVPSEDHPRTVDRIGEMITGANVGPTGGTFSDSSEIVPSRSSPSNPTFDVPSTNQSNNRKHRYSPVVLRLAQEKGINLDTIEGTGIGGRITKRDILEAATADELDTANPTKLDGQDKLVDPSPIRKIIASNMQRSWKEIPHAWSTIEIDVTNLVCLRESLKNQFFQRHGAPLSYIAFSINALADSLRSNPLLNSSWENNRIRLKHDVNIGIAVAAKEGLVVPVVHCADQLGVGELARKIAPLVERARNNKLNSHDMQNGTFTLNNTGALGSIWGGAIINYPQAAIINTESIVRRPVVIKTPQGDSVKVRSMMNICLSFDHRVMDGNEASAFMQDFKSRLEDFGPDTKIN